MIVVGMLLLGIAQRDTGDVSVTVDSARHEVVILAGPFQAPSTMSMPGHDMMDHGMSHDSPLQRFNWPVDGWLRGFRIELVDATGQPVARRVLHHLIVVNFARRQLIYDAYERLLGAGAETADVVLPRTVGIPVRAGMPLGLYAGWHNETGKDLDGVVLRLTILWMPANQNPVPVNVLPFYADVNLNTGGSNTFDVPPGISRKDYQFMLPVGGRLLGVGGHLHDYGLSLELREETTGRVLTVLKAKRDSAGHVLGVERRLFGVRGEGLRLRSGRGYRIVGVYQNPTDETRVRGAMASMVGLFVPEDLGRWPTLEPDSPELARDLEGLGPAGPAGDTEARGASHR
jgi:hypothetical protein